MLVREFNTLENAYNLVLLEKTLSKSDQEKLAKILAEIVAGQAKNDKLSLEIIDNPDKIQEILQDQDVQQEAVSQKNSIENKYAAFVKNINKILWEMGEDVKTTKDQTNIQNYTKIIQGIQKIYPEIKPAPSMLQKGMYNVGKVVGGVGKAVATGLVAKSLATVGLPLAVVGAVVGGGAVALKNLANTNLTPQEKLKKALIAAGIGGAIGFAMDHLKTLLPDHGATHQSGTVSGGIRDPEQFKTLTAEYIKQNPTLSKYYDVNRITIQGDTVKVPSIDGSPPWSFSMRDKIQNAIEARATRPGAISVNDMDGFLGKNIFPKK